MFDFLNVTFFSDHKPVITINVGMLFAINNYNSTHLAQIENIF